MSRTYKDSGKKSNKLSKKVKRELERLQQGDKSNRNYSIVEFKSAYKKLKVEE